MSVLSPCRPEGETSLAVATSPPANTKANSVCAMPVVKKKSSDGGDASIALVGVHTGYPTYQEDKSAKDKANAGYK